MKGAALHGAQTVLSAALNALNPRSTFNIICFGARERRLFCDPQPARFRDLRARALEFVADAKADLSVSDAASALQQLYLQAIAEGSPRAIFLFTGTVHLLLSISVSAHTCSELFFFFSTTDGFLLDESRCLFLASHYSARTRLFTFGTGTQPNRGFLLSLARAGAGEAEIVTEEIDPKDAARRQLQRAAQPCMHFAARFSLSTFRTAFYASFTYFCSSLLRSVPFSVCSVAALRDGRCFGEHGTRTAALCVQG